ncbi:MAG: GHKL domain-containing protein [Acidobacteria bacterium]|nr:GHKL domain-containing protein [Acidobacteriota bacterium]
MYKLRKSILQSTAIVLCLLIPIGLFAEEYLQKIFGYKEGLPQSQVFALVEDRDGYLWVGTQYGLARFNGYEFNIFYKQEGLPSSIIYALDSDPDGNLWIGTSTGLSMWDGSKFIEYPLQSGELVDIRDIHIDSKNRVYFTTSNDWGCIEDGKIVLLGEKYNTLDLKLTKITGDKNGTLYIGTETQTVLSIADNQVTRIKLSDNNAHISSLLWDAENKRLYVGTNDGLFIIKNGNVRCSTSSVFYKGHPITGICKKGETLYLILYDLGIYSDTNGSIKLEYRNSRFLYNDLLIDTYDDLWIGLDGSGLVRLSLSPFKSIPILNGPLSGYPMSFTQDYRGRIWVGTFGSGIFVFRDENDTNPMHYYFEGAEINSIRSVIHTAPNETWVGTIDGVVRIIDDKIQHFSTTDGITAKIVRNIYEDRKGALWISTDDGITIYENGKFSPFKLNHKLLHRNTLQVLQDKRGTYWIASLGGLYSYNGIDLIRFESPTFPTDLQIETIFIDSKGQIWLGGVFGLGVIDEEGVYKKFTEYDGFTRSFVYFIIEDNENCMWVGTSYGLQNLRNDHFFLYSQDNGLVGTEANSRACLKDKSGKLWFGFLEGVSVLIKDKISRIKKVPEIIIDEFIVDGESYLDRNTLVVSPSARTIFIKYHGVLLNPGHGLRYSYMLEPLDKDWSIPTSNRFTQYSYLKPGRYTFKVHADIGPEQTELKITELSFHIIPPVWRRTWFIFLISAFVISTLGLIIWLRIRMLQREKEMLHAAVSERTKELKEKNEELESFAYTVSHDLKDPVGVIVGYAQVLDDFLKKKNISGADKFIEGIKRNSKKLVSFIDDLLQLSRSGRIIEKFTKTDVNVIVKQIKKEFEEKGGVDKPVITFKKLPIIFADTDRLYTVFHNLITNAYKYRHTSRRPKIQITYHLQGDKHIFEVIDNGVGIKSKDILRIFEPGVRLNSVITTGSGFGLKIVQKIVKAHGGEIWVESEFGKGSNFSFSLQVIDSEKITLS